jgi:thioredoxin-related protein
MKNITSKTFEKEHQGAYVVILYYDEGCPACKRFDKVYRKLEDENRSEPDSPRIRFLRMKISGNEGTAFAQRVTEWPMMIFYHRGRRVGKVAGALPVVDARKVMRNLLKRY